MTPKEAAIDAILRLPDSATWLEIEERIRLLAAIERGLDDVKHGRVIPHEAVKEGLKHGSSA